MQADIAGAPVVIGIYLGAPDVIGDGRRLQRKAVFRVCGDCGVADLWSTNDKIPAQHTRAGGFDLDGVEGLLGVTRFFGAGVQ